MDTSHKQLLEDKLDYLYENMEDVVILLPLFLEKETITPAQALYIETPAFCKQRIERLIEVLVTRENGYHSFCEALKLSGQTTLAKFVRDINGMLSTFIYLIDLGDLKNLITIPSVHPEAQEEGKLLFIIIF